MQRSKFYTTVASAILILLPASQTFAASSLNFSESQNGKTVGVSKGSLLHITLHSTYWKFGIMKKSGILLVGTPTTLPEIPTQAATINCQHPGSGCGTVSAQYKAAKSGTYIIEASRTLCGEALRCSQKQSKFSITVVVK